MRQVAFRGVSVRRPTQLECLNGARERGLGDIAALGCFSQIQGLANRQKIADLMQFPSSARDFNRALVSIKLRWYARQPRVGGSYRCKHDQIGSPQPCHS